MPWIAALLASFAPMLKDLFFKILIALGFTFVSYKTTSSVLQTLLDYVAGSYFQLSPTVLGLLGLAGIPTALNIIFGAFNVCIGLFTAGKAIKFMSK